MSVPEPNELVYDRENPDRTGPALVNHHLRRLGLGENWTAGGRVLPAGLGWCRAGGAPEEAWPQGADLCVLVDWHPDETYRRDHDRGRVPPGAEQHWQERIPATIAALESIDGFVAETRGPRRTPHHHPRAEIVVYRMRPGVPAPRQPADAWKNSPPARPNYKSRLNSYPSPTEPIERVLGQAQLSRWDFFGPSRVGLGCVVQDISPSLWPLNVKELCGRVVWRPAPEQGHDSEQWTHAMTLITETLCGAGYQLQVRERPWTAADDCLALLVYKPHGPSASHPLHSSERE